MMPSWLVLLLKAAVEEGQKYSDSLEIQAIPAVPRRKDRRNSLRLSFFLACIPFLPTAPPSVG